jgi:ATP-dependent Lhr-like helicase
VLRQLRQRSLAALRREVEPTDAAALARFLPAWHGIGSSARGLDRVVEAVALLHGVAIPASVLERDVLPARVADYSPRMLDELAAAGELVWVGAGPLGRDDGKVMLLFRDQAGLLVPSAAAAAAAERPSDDEHERIRDVLQQRGACFFRELAGPDDGASLDALWDLVWAGDVTNDSLAALRAFVAGAPKKASASSVTRRRPNLGSLSALGPPRAQGRWSLVPAPVGSPTDRAIASAQALLERHGVLTREAARGEGVPGGFAGVYPVLRAMEESGRVRRGYFVAGLGGAQFALPGAVDRLRTFRDADGDDELKPMVLAATDPANPFGVALPWPDVAGSRTPQRVAGAYVVLLGGRPSLYVEKSGRGLVALRELDGAWEETAVGALVGLVGAGRFRKLALERFDPALEPFLRTAGFVPSPRGLVHYG